MTALCVQAETAEAEGMGGMVEQDEMPAIAQNNFKCPKCHKVRRAFRGAYRALVGW